jgi:hypothetical protein
MSYRMTITLKALRVRVVIYALGAYKVFIESVVIELRKGPFDWISKGLVPFLIVESDWKA